MVMSKVGITPEAQLAQAIKSLGDTLHEIYTPRSNSGKSVAKPLTIALDLRGLGGRMTVEVWVKSSAAADFFVEGSANGQDFRKLYTLSVPGGGGENHEGFMNAYPVIRVRTEAAYNSEIEIVAAR